MILRKGLIYLRKKFNEDKSKFLMTYIPISVLLTALSIVVDIYLPHNTLWNFLRTFIMIPLSVSIFSFAYFIGLSLHNAKTLNDESWMPFRYRFSPSWRRRIALIIASFLFLTIYAVGIRPGRTFVASIIIALGIALASFVRMTNKERRREELNIPDVRDLRYEERKKQLEEVRRLSEKEKRVSNSQKKNKRWGIKDDDFEDED